MLAIYGAVHTALFTLLYNIRWKPNGGEKHCVNQALYPQIFLGSNQFSPFSPVYDLSKINPLYSLKWSCPSDAAHKLRTFYMGRLLAERAIVPDNRPLIIHWLITLFRGGDKNAHLLAANTPQSKLGIRCRE